MTTEAEIQHLEQHGLYSASNEHDACGLGFVAHIKGEKRHDIVTQALKILENIDHRGAVGADKLMGDGAGILIQIPDALYREEMGKQGIELPPYGEYGVGMIFLPKEHASRMACEQEMERAIKAEGQVLLGWRDVPVNREMPMSPAVKKTEPILRQVFIGRGNDVIVQDALERKLYVIRKTASANIQNLEAQAQQGILRSEHVEPHGGLQGPAAGRPGGRVLPRPVRRALRVGHRPGAPALLDQHLPQVAAGPPVPLCRPQRRNQHGARQLQLDEGARRRDVVAGARGRPEEAVPDQLRGPVRHRHLRQLPRTHDHGRLPDQPGRDDDSPSRGSSTTRWTSAAARSTSTTPR